MLAKSTMAVLGMVMGFQLDMREGKGMRGFSLPYSDLAINILAVVVVKPGEKKEGEMCGDRGAFGVGRLRGGWM